MIGTPPPYLEGVQPRQRMFPASWRDAAIRALWDEARGGVACPGCGRIFRTRAELRALQADHIDPWIAGGLTSWANLQLLCAPCNYTKGAR